MRRGCAAAAPLAAALVATAGASALAEPEPVSLVDRKLTLPRGDLVVDGSASATRYDDRYYFNTTASFGVSGRLGVTHGFELDTNVPFSYDGIGVSFGGPGLGARFLLLDGTTDIALRLDVNGIGLSERATDGVGINFTHGVQLSHEFGHTLRADVSFYLSNSIDASSTLGASVPIGVTIALSRALYLSVGTGFSRGDIRTATSMGMSLSTNLTHVVERNGRPLFDISAGLRRPNIFTYTDTPYAVFSAGFDVAVHTSL